MVGRPSYVASKHHEDAGAAWPEWKKKGRKMGQRKFEWTAEKERAVGLLAEGASHRDIAKQGVARKSIERWKRHPEFARRLQDLVGAAREQAKRTLLGKKEARIQILEELYSRQRAIIDERAADPEMQAVPGGRTGLLVRKTVVSSGTLISYEYVADTTLSNEIRKTLQQVALEVGDGRQKVDVQDNFSKPSEASITLAKVFTIEELTELEKRAKLLMHNADWRPVPHSNLFSAAPDLLISQ
jgi:hypothetical protein